MSALLAVCVALVPLQAKHPQPQVHPQDRTPVVLHLVDREGLPYTSAGRERDLRLNHLPSSRSRDYLGSRSFEWPEGPQVFCTPTREDVFLHPRLGPSEPLTASHEVEPGSFRFLLEPGFSYELGVRGGAVACVSTVVSIPQDGEPRTIQRTLCVSASPIGTLRIKILNPQGQPLIDGVAVQVEDASTGLPVVSRSRITSADQVFRLPLGDYRVRCYSCGTEVSLFCGTEMYLNSEIKHGGVTAQVSVSKSETPIRELQLDRGGKIMVDLCSLSRLGEDDPNWVELLLLPEEGWSFRPEFVSRRSKNSASLMSMRLSPGQVLTSEWIPAGRYELLAKTLDGRTSRQCIEVHETVTTETVLLFEEAK